MYIKHNLHGFRPFHQQKFNNRQRNIFSQGGLVSINYNISFYSANGRHELTWRENSNSIFKV